MSTEADEGPSIIDLAIGRILLVLVLAFAFLINEVRRVFKANSLRRQLAATASELQREREEVLVARAEAQRVEDLFMSSQSKARQEYQALGLKAQERQIRDEGTIAEMERRLERAESRICLLAKENKEYKDNSTFMKEKIEALSTRMSRIGSRNAELEITMVRRENQIVWLTKDHGKLAERIVFGKKTIAKQKQEFTEKTQELAKQTQALAKQTQELAEKEKEAVAWKDLYILCRSGESSHQQRLRSGPSEELSIANLLAEKDQKIEELKDRLSECVSQLDVCTCPRKVYDRVPLPAQSIHSF
ncbi:hypothetical protein EST38_g6272 [Candolleomyces aberdarensis]|uniref:Uncharacterized protein n=1 Tax=Candolleomyces aberdarensis TaxID=2316362 RepID=A0A4Q2DK66_9AGAR|nr:hypothetical protein EST38_g6272 [Candolleomyces aberdarensis]